MSFLNPERLWLLLFIPVLVGGYITLQRRRRHYALRFTNLALVDSVLPRRPQWRQHTAVGLAMLTLGGLVFCFARPAQEQQVQARVNKPQVVVICIDTSTSMGARDVVPTRLAAAEHAAKDFLANLPSKFEVALVTFARGATVRVPPTRNRQQVANSIEALHLGEYTATGEGIYSSLDVIKQARAGDTNLPGVVVLLSDGTRTVGRSALQAARDAKSERVPVYTVALGTPEGVIANPEAPGVVPVPVDRQQLRQIAQLSGGKAYDAQTPKDLNLAYNDVGKRLVTVVERRDVTARYLGIVVLLGMLSSAGAIYVASRLA
jgi:Ca-activated chloride channel family protein